MTTPGRQGRSAQHTHRPDTVTPQSYPTNQLPVVSENTIDYKATTFLRSQCQFGLTVKVRDTFVAGPPNSRKQGGMVWGGGGADA